MEYKKLLLKEIDWDDKGNVCMPRKVSCTINRTFANWGRVGHNVPQTRINTTVSTTKGLAGEGIKANVWG